MISELAIDREVERNPGLGRMQAYRRIKAREEISRRNTRCIPHAAMPVDVTDASAFPNIAEAVAHAKAIS